MAFKGNSSRNAPKFIVRFPSNTMRDAVAAAAARSYTSMNSFMLQAVAEKLARVEQQN